MVKLVKIGLWGPLFVPLPSFLVDWFTLLLTLAPTHPLNCLFLHNKKPFFVLKGVWGVRRKVGRYSWGKGPSSSPEVSMVELVNKGHRRAAPLLLLNPAFPGPAPRKGARARATEAPVPVLSYNGITQKGLHLR